jgi:hypothetical protein
MMKKALLFLTLLGFSLSASAQFYGANRFYVGPSIGGGFYSTNMSKEDGGWNESIGNFNPHFSAGAFFGYSFSDLFGFQVEGLYRGTFGGDWKSGNIQIPAMIMVQFAEHQHFGLGIIYNHTLNNPSYFEGPIQFEFESVTNSSIYAYAEFSSLTEKIFKDGNYTVFTGELRKLRAFFKFAYAITPTTIKFKPNSCPITLWEAPPSISFRPFFFEFGVRYDIPTLFDSGNNTKPNRRRKR